MTQCTTLAARHDTHLLLFHSTVHHSTAPTPALISYPFYVYELQSPRSGRFFLFFACFRQECVYFRTPWFWVFGLGFLVFVRGWCMGLGFVSWVSCLGLGLVSGLFFTCHSPLSCRLPLPPLFQHQLPSQSNILNLCNNIEHHTILQQLRTTAKLLSVYILDTLTPLLHRRITTAFITFSTAPR